MTEVDGLGTHCLFAEKMMGPKISKIVMTVTLGASDEQQRAEEIDKVRDYFYQFAACYYQIDIVVTEEATGNTIFECKGTSTFMERLSLIYKCPASEIEVNPEFVKKFGIVIPEESATEEASPATPEEEVQLILECPTVEPELRQYIQKTRNFFKARPKLPIKRKTPKEQAIDKQKLAETEAARRAREFAELEARYPQLSPPSTSYAFNATQNSKSAARSPSYTLKKRMLAKERAAQTLINSKQIRSIYLNEIRVRNAPNSNKEDQFKKLKYILRKKLEMSNTSKENRARMLKAKETKENRLKKVRIKNPTPRSSTVNDSLDQNGVESNSKNLPKSSESLGSDTNSMPSLLFLG